ncbi:hypothetical protein MHU86_24234 [Fragilaria crotonensis]|nr:hypothetical protein MHU86_24234 [Fragilaria crotonensis]
MENRICAKAVGDVARKPLTDGIDEDDCAEEFSSDMLIMDMAPAPSGSSPSASLPSASKVYGKDSRDVARGIGTKKLEYAPPIEPMSLARSAAVPAGDHDVGPGAFPVRTIRNTAASLTFRPSIRSYDSTSDLTSEESRQEDGAPNSTGTHTNAVSSSEIAAGSGFYTMEAQRVPDDKDGTMLVAEAEHLKTKWYQRRWIFVGLALLACCLVGAVVVMVVLLVRSPAAASSSSSLIPPTRAPTKRPPPTRAPTKRPPPTPDPTVATSSPVAEPTTPPVAAPTTPPVAAPTTPPVAAPTTPPVAAPTTPPVAAPLTSPSSTPETIACRFLSIPDVTSCRSTFVFESELGGDTTTGSTIPSEIGLLTQLTYLDFYNNSLTSSIPSEIGLLTQLTVLSFYKNSLTSTIPSEIGLLTKLTSLIFWENLLTSTIPRAIGLLTRLTMLDFDSTMLTGTIPSSLCSLSSITIYNDGGEITCNCCS